MVKDFDRRSGYLLDQTQIMMKIQDNLQADQDGEKHVSRFAMALEASQLARDLKKVYEDLCQTGYVEVRINRWSEILFCLPQKVHKKVNIFKRLLGWLSAYQWANF